MKITSLLKLAYLLIPLYNLYTCYTDPNNIEVIDQPDTYLPCSILVMLCCCPLFGFVALIYSFQVSDM